MRERIAIVIGLAACGRIGFDVGVNGDGRLGDDGGGDGTPPVIVTNRVFVTSTTQVPSSFNGTAGGDQVCSDRAAAAGLPGPYLAWLSSSTVDAIDRLTSSRGWSRTDGLPFADQPTEIANEQLRYPIRADEFGHDIGAAETEYAATGTFTDGTANNDCMEWADPSSMVMIGETWSAGGAWTNTNTVMCGQQFRLYCFGVGLKVPLVVTPATGKRAFLSSPTFMPSSGLAAADALCASDATSAGLAGTFLALLETTTTSGSRFDTVSAGSWVRVDGIPLGATFAEALVAPTAPLDVTAGGQYIDSLVITGGGPTEAPDPGFNCNDWSNAGGGSEFGRGTATGDNAFNDTTGACNTASSVYCYQQ